MGSLLGRQGGRGVGRRRAPREMVNPSGNVQSKQREHNVNINTTSPTPICNNYVITVMSFFFFFISFCFFSFLSFFLSPLSISISISFYLFIRNLSASFTIKREIVQRCRLSFFFMASISILHSTLWDFKNILRIHVGNVEILTPWCFAPR